MVQALFAALLFAAAPASAAAPLALPSFESAAFQLQASVKAMRAAQVQAKSADIGPRLDSMSWDLQRAAQDVERMRDDLRLLMTRVDTIPPGGRVDPNLGWDLQRFNQDLDSLAGDGRFRLNDLNVIAAQAEKDPSLVGRAQNLVNAAGGLKSDTKWLVFDVGFDVSDLMRAGFGMEEMDLDRNSRELDQNASDLQSGAERVLAKVR